MIKTKTKNDSLSKYNVHGLTSEKQSPYATSQFLLLSGLTHSSDYHMWQRNDFASNGVREFAEKGEAWTLMKEVEAAGERIQSVYGILSAPAVVGGTGQMNTEFEVSTRHSYVSYSTPGFLQCEQAKYIRPVADRWKHKSRWCWVVLP